MFPVPVGDAREWLGVVVSHGEDDVVVRLPDGSDGDALPDELWAVAVTPFGPPRFPTTVLERAGTALSCRTPRDLELADRR